MKLIIDEGLFADLAQKIKSKMDSRHQAAKNQNDNAEEYAVYDQMLDVLRSKGYSNAELNMLQRYMLTSNNYDGIAGADPDNNMIYDVALNNDLDIERIRYLGRVSSGSEKFNKEDFNFLASCGSVDQMKALYYAHTLNIPFDKVGSFNGKPPATNQIVNVIRNYDQSKENKESPMQKKLSFLDAKGYSSASFLVNDNFEDVPDDVLADAVVASVLGHSSSKIKSALSSMGFGSKKNESYIIEKGEISYKDLQNMMAKNPDFAKQVQAIGADKGLYSYLSIPETTPHYTLDQLKTKSAQTIKKEIDKAIKSSNEPTKADKVNQNEANNNQ